MHLEEILNEYGLEICCASFIILPIIITSSISKGLRMYEQYFNRRQKREYNNKVQVYNKF